MSTSPKLHTFHIPVMGLAFTLDTAIKVAHLGIDSVASIVDDNIVEQLRVHYAKLHGMTTEFITKKEHDYRARRITGYLNLVHQIVQEKFAEVRQQAFLTGSVIDQYFSLLPETNELKKLYNRLAEFTDGERENVENTLRKSMRAGRIDVNIMTKIDNVQRDAEGNELPIEYCDALAALRGFATSTLDSSLVFSAGMNPRLFSYMTTFSDFYPNEDGYIRKKIILKVSDFRSALIQGKFLAKKGLWVTEFRIESGLNCGGHAFASDGYLFGPILHEFKEKRHELQEELFQMCNRALAQLGKSTFPEMPSMRVTAQGGVGTAKEHEFLLEYYNLDSIGWGSPFLLVPEATSVDDHTRQQLATAKPEDYYLSRSSPLGVPFNNFRGTTSDKQRLERIAKGKPGSACLKKFLQSNYEFSQTSICTASTQYLYHKMKELKNADMSEEERERRKTAVLEKDCLCEGLSASARLANGINDEKEFNAVIICPGPNLAYFSGVFTLEQMVGHIYGRTHILNSVPRPNLFVNELVLYIKYMIQELNSVTYDPKKNTYWTKFRDTLLTGVEYYKNLAAEQVDEVEELFDEMLEHLAPFEEQLREFVVGEPMKEIALKESDLKALLV